MPDNDDPQVKNVLEQIDSYRARSESPSRRRWRLGVPSWQVGIEAAAVFGIAFLVGRGMAVLYLIFSGN